MLSDKMAEWGMMRHQGQICTCIWQGFIHKGIFSDVLSDKMAEKGMMRHRGLRSVWQGFIHKGIFSDVLSDKMAEKGIMRHRGLRSVHVFGKVLSIRVYFQMC